MTTTPVEKLCTRDLAAALGVARSTIELWVRLGWIPRPQRRGNFSMHKVADVIAVVKYRNLKVDQAAIEVLDQPKSKVPT